MARCRPFLALLATLAVQAIAQDSPPPGPPPKDDHPFKPDGPWKRGHRPDGFRPDGPHGDAPRHDGNRPSKFGGEMTMEMMRDRVLKELEKLTPEQRMEVWRTTWAVLKMPPEKKKDIIGFDEDRRRQVREEIDRTLQETGIELEEGRRREFFGRYFQGRREIETQLIKEGDERRKELMKEFAAKLKAEFAKPADTQSVEKK